MKISPEINGASIVLAGHFNPMIFHPSWFVEHEIISKEEANAANTEIVHPEISKFDIEWLSIRVEKSLFIAETKMPPLIRVSDFIVKTFGDFLMHTPVSHVGINRTVHFKVTDQKKLDQLGTTLAPQNVWGDWGGKIAGPSTGEKHGGLRVIVMEQRDLDDRYRGHIQAKVEPSRSILNGVIVDINDHYEIENYKNLLGCNNAIDIVSNKFELSIRRSEQIINHIMSLAL